MKNLLSISEINILSKGEQQKIKGGASVDPTKCSCSCSGSIVGPFYCSQIMGCLDVYTCNDNTI